LTRLVVWYIFGVVEINNPGQGTSVPFEMKGGSPIVLHVTLPAGTYEIRIAPMIFDVRYLPDVVNLLDPSVPTFALQANMQVTTRKL
jgi:hypothetical protein